MTASRRWRKSAEFWPFYFRPTWQEMGRRLISSYFCPFNSSLNLIKFFFLFLYPCSPLFTVNSKFSTLPSSLRSPLVSNGFSLTLPFKCVCVYIIFSVFHLFCIYMGSVCLCVHVHVIVDILSAECVSIAWRLVWQCLEHAFLLGTETWQFIMTSNYSENEVNPKWAKPCSHSHTHTHSYLIK